MPRSSIRNQNLLTLARDWLTRGRRPVWLLTLAGIAVSALVLTVDVHGNFRDGYVGVPAGESIFAYFVLPFARRHLVILFVALMPAFLAYCYRNREESLVPPFMLVSLALIAGWLPGEIVYSYPLLKEGPIGEEPAVFAFLAKLVLVFLFLGSPPLLAWIYRRMSTLDRYVLRSFLIPFTLCLCSFIAIWLIIDLMDNGPDFKRGNSSLLEIGYFYVVQLPQVLLLVMPVTLLLSLLYSLGKMSSHNELVSMVGAGKSTLQVFLPLFGFGLYMTFVCVVLNYEWAPWSVGHKDSVLRKIRSGYEDKTLATNHLHHNSVDQRTWYIRLIPFNMLEDAMRVVEIREHDDSGHLKKTYYAGTARWRRDTNTWSFDNAAVYHYNEEGVPHRIETFDSFDRTDWKETPFKIVSSSFNPEFLGVPGLTSFLKSNAEYEESQLAPFRAHWHYRWALPFSCFVVTLVAAPLGIVYSRRGILGSVAAAVFIFFAMMFLEHFFLSLGLGNHIPPFFSAWTNNFIFAVIGGVLFYCRARNRSLPSLKRLFASRDTAEAG